MCFFRASREQSSVNEPACPVDFAQILVLPSCGLTTATSFDWKLSP